MWEDKEKKKSNGKAYATLLSIFSLFIGTPISLLFDNGPVILIIIYLFTIVILMLIIENL